MSEKPQKRIIKSKKTFADLFQTGKKVSSELLHGIYLTKNTLTDLQFNYAVAVSKKISKKAVIRNRLKRLLRENIRGYLNKQENYLLKLEYIVLIWRKPVKTRFDVSFEEVKKNIEKIFKDLEEKLDKK
jgi:ribonuclease P protein component